MKNLIAPAALLALLCFTPLLHAQDEVDPKRAAAAEDLLAAMHSDQMMAKLMDSQKENVKKMTGRLMPADTSPEVRKRFEDAQDAALDTVFKQLTWDSLKPDFVQIYAQVFTEQELKDLAAFYRTPIGQKLTEKMPELQSKTMEVMQARMVTLMPEIQAAVKDALQKARGGDAGPQPPAQ